MKLITDEELDILDKLERGRTQGDWHFVDQPWWDGQGVSHVIAGNHDPHVGIAVLNGIDIDSADGEDDEDCDRNWANAEAEMNRNLVFAAAAATLMRRLIDSLRHYKRSLKPSSSSHDFAGGGNNSDKS